MVDAPDWMKNIGHAVESYASEVTGGFRPGIGAAFVGMQGTAESNAAAQAMAAQSTANGNKNPFNPDTYIGPAMAGMEWAQDKSYRGVSAVEQMATLQKAGWYNDSNMGHGSITNWNDWVKAWNRGLTPAQGLNMLLGTKPGDVTLQDDPNSVKAREDYFHNTWAGRLSTGPLDMAFGFVADPTIVGGKAGMALKAAKYAAKGEKAVDALFATNEAVHAANVGDEAAKGTVQSLSRAAVKKNQRFEQTLASFDDKSLPEVMNSPLMPDAGGGVYAMMLHEAAVKFPGSSAAEVAARREAQRLAFGAMLGHQGSINTILDKSATLTAESDDAIKAAKSYTDLARSIRNLSQPPGPTIAQGLKDSGMDEQMTIDTLSDMYATEMTEKADDIGYELQRLDAAHANMGQVNKYAATRSQQLSWSAANRSFRNTYLDKGKGHTPIRLVSGLLSDRLPNHINTFDPSIGGEQLDDALRRADWMTGDKRIELLTEFHSADTEVGRNVAAAKARAAVIHSIAERRGLTPEHAQQIINSTSRTTETLRNALKGRLYSAHDQDPHVAYYDYDPGEIYAVSRPILGTQIEHTVTFPDPRLLDKTVSQVMSKAPVRIARQGTEALSEQALRPLNNVFKASILMRPAYGFRVQMDSQLRLLAWMGMLSQAMNMRYAPRAGARFLLSDPEGNLPLLSKAERAAKAEEEGVESVGRRNPDYQKRNALKFWNGNFAASLTPALKKQNLSDDQVNYVVRMMEEMGGETGTGMADMLASAADIRLKNLRATGEFDVQSKDDAMWPVHYDRVVNHQIANDDAAMFALQGQGEEALVKEAQTAGSKVRAEWLRVREAWKDRTIYDWAHETQSMVDYYLADPEARDWMLENGKIGPSKINEIFGGAENRARRMDVHGAQYLGTERQNVFKAGISNLRDGFFRFVGEAPEMLLARHPMFNYAFNRRLATIQKNVGRELTEKEFDNARWAAVKGARKDMGKVLFDTSTVSNLSRSLATIHPFFAAWEDSMRKWFNIIYAKPYAAARLDHFWDWPENLGLTTDSQGNSVDENGNHYDKNGNLVPVPQNDDLYVTIPFKKITGGRINDWTFRRASLNASFQGAQWFLPGYGPLAQVPANQVIKTSFPEFADSPYAQWLLPFGITNENPIEQVMPAWARSGWTAFQGEDSQQYNNTWNQFMQDEDTKFRLGQRKTAPTDAEISNMARNWWIMKSIAGFAAPVTAAPADDLDFYRQQAQALRSNLGSQWPDSIPQSERTNEPYWEFKFKQLYPQYYELTLGLSVSNDGISATVAGRRAEQKYRKEIGANPEFGQLYTGADWTYGPGADHQFNNNVYTWQQQAIGDGQSLPFRGKKSPVEAGRQARTAAGWQEYQTFMATIQQVMDQNGITSIRKAPRLAALKKAFTDDLAKRNDDWGRDYGQTDSRKSVDFLKKAHDFVNAHPEVQKRADIIAVQQYIQLRQATRQVMDQNGFKTLNSQQAKNLATWFDGEVNKLKQSSIGFEQDWNRWLQNDDPGTDLEF